MSQELYTTVKEATDPRNGTVAIFFGRNHESDTPGFWVEAHRTDFYSDYVSEQEAEELFAEHVNNSQR